MKKIFLLIFTTILFYSSSYAQFEDFEEETSEVSKIFRERIFYGGDFGLQFGSETLIHLSPQIGYYITDFWSFGIGSTFIYRKIKIFNYSNAIYGGSFFTELYPFNFIVLHGEAQFLNSEYYDNSNNKYRDWNLGLLGGGGYRMKIGKKGAVNYMILWDFNQNQKSVFINPIFRISIYF